MAKLRVLFEAGPMVDKHKTGVGYFVDYLVQSLAKTDSVDLTGYYFDFLGKNGIVFRLKLISFPL